MSSTPEETQALALRLANLLQTYIPDDDPAIWATRACAFMAQTIGDTSITKQQMVENMEILFALCPDPIVSATAELINYYDTGVNK